MTERIKALKEYIISKKHHALRTDRMPREEVYSACSVTNPEKAMELYLREMLSAQDPIFLPNERIAVTRSTKFTRPDIAIPLEEYIPENGWLCNLNPDYSYILDKGFVAVKKDIESAKAVHPERADYADVLLSVCDDILNFTEIYRAEAEKNGLNEIAERLKRVPAYAPKS